MSRWRRRLTLAVSPPSVVTRKDTSLRFTDILFGFVIREIFLRLQAWSDLSGPVRCQLVASSALVLGSWIGFRRSVHRSDYEPAFFNLPFAKFVVDQLMLILYFRVSVSVPQTPSDTPLSSPELARGLTWNLVLVFGLYLVWDLLGRRMAVAMDHTVSPPVIKYPLINDDGEKTDKAQGRNGWGLVISIVAFAVFFLIWRIAEGWSAMTDRVAMTLMIVATALLLFYRFAKEVRTSWRSLSTT